MEIYPHLRDLRYFVAVAEELHFTKAARRLRIAQPTLSRQIRQLERQLDVVLFDRNQRNVALTIAGKDLLAGAIAILEQWNRTGSGLRTAGTVLRIGIQSSSDMGVIAELERKAVVRLSPHVVTSDASGGLATRKTDIAVLWLPPPDPHRFPRRVLRTTPRWVLLPERHRLAESVVRFGDISDEPFIALPSKAGPARDYWLGADVRGSTPAMVGGVADTVEERLELVGMERGLLLLPQSDVALYRWPGIKAQPVADLPWCELTIVWRSDENRREVLDFATSAVLARVSLR